MKFRVPHPWSVTPGEAVKIQRRLRSRLRLKSGPRKVRWVAGADMAIADSGKTGIAAVVVFRLPELEIVEKVHAEGRLRFPYVPGLLSFRETPVLLKAFEKLRSEPDVIFVDGQGTAHPRGFGIACHLGLILDRPTIGCAKSRLVGEARPPGPRRGAWSPLKVRGQTVGAVLRTRDGTNPIFVSPGHRISLREAIRVTMACADGFRIPKPTRIADQIVGMLKRNS